MRATFVSVALWWVLAPLQQVHALPEGHVIECMSGIVTALDRFVFGDDIGDYYTGKCMGNYTTPSLYAAAKLYCTPEEITAGEELWSYYCSHYGLVELIPYKDMLPKLTDDFIASLKVIGYSDIDATVIWNQSLLISKDYWKVGRDTTETFDDMIATDQRYGFALYGFWAIIIFIGMMNRLFEFFFHRRLERKTGDAEGRQAAVAPKSGVLGRVSSTFHWIRAHFIIPATHPTHHQKLIWGCQLPVRWATFLIVSYYIINFLLCALSYIIFWPNLYYNTVEQNWRYIADRTGILAYANLPLMWIFAGRNNIFLWLTGYSFATFNIFHRHIARIATIQGIVHSIAYSVLYSMEGYYYEEWTEEFFYMGALATVLMSLLVLFSFAWFRAKVYEIFLVIHIIFSAGVIAGLFYHTKIYDGEYDPYLWPLVAIWCFDRFVRIVRQVYCNLHVWLDGTLYTTKTIATYDRDSDLIRLEVTPGSRMLKPKPGQHYYLYQVLRWKGWENHPFTLSAWEDLDRPANRPVQRFPDLGKEVSVDPNQTSSSSSNDQSSVASAEHGAPGHYKMIFMVRPFSSWTRRLRDQCLKSASGSITAKLMIEGPYGRTEPLHNYDNVIYIVGGSGLTAALPYIQEHVERSNPRANTNFSSRKDSSRTTNIVLVWTARQAAFIHDVARRELRAALARPEMHATFFATRDTDAHIAAAARLDEKVDEAGNAPAAAALDIRHGRPNVAAAIAAAVGDIAAGGSKAGRTAVLTCGPASLADETRAAVHAALKGGKRDLDYYEESFGW